MKNSSRHDVLSVFNTTGRNLQIRHSSTCTTMQSWKSTLIQYYHETHRFHSNFASSPIIPLFPCPRSSLGSCISFSGLFVLLQYGRLSQSHCCMTYTLLRDVRLSTWCISLSLILLNVSSYIESVHDFWRGQP